MKNIVTELISLHYGRFWCFTVMIQNDHRRPSWIVSLDKKFPMGLMNNCAKWEHLYWEYRLEIFRCYGLWYLDLINAKISILKKMDIGQYNPHPTIFLLIYWLWEFFQILPDFQKKCIRAVCFLYVSNHADSKYVYEKIQNVSRISRKINIVGWGSYCPISILQLLQERRFLFKYVIISLGYSQYSFNFHYFLT